MNILKTLLLTTTILAAPLLAQADDTPLTRLIAKAQPSVVTIFAKATNDAKSGNIGTGSIIDNEGRIVTNSHVIHGKKFINIYLNGSKAPIKAKVIGEDVDDDLAVIQVDPRVLPKAIMPIGDSDKVVVGDQVVAIGAPFGLAGTVTVGHVSTIHRNAGGKAMSDAIQTDADINPGNSGGPLINSKGEMIGVNSAAIGPGDEGGSVGLGLAIPSNHVKEIVDQILKDKK